MKVLKIWEEDYKDRTSARKQIFEFQLPVGKTKPKSGRQWTDAKKVVQSDTMKELWDRKKDTLYERPTKCFKNFAIKTGFETWMY